MVAEVLWTAEGVLRVDVPKISHSTVTLPFISVVPPITVA